MSAASMPTSVKVGPLRYAVVTDAALINAKSAEANLEGGEWVAFSNHHDLVIGINPGHHTDVNRVSLLHEVAHCCLRASGAWPGTYSDVLSEARDDHGVGVEEFVIAAMSGPLLMVLRDNPELTAWLTEETP